MSSSAEITSSKSVRIDLDGQQNLETELSNSGISPHSVVFGTTIISEPKVPNQNKWKNKWKSEDNYHDDNYAGRNSKLIFLFGIVIPPLWLLALYYRSSRSKEAYRWRRMAYIGLTSYLLLSLLLVWIGLIVIFNLYRFETVGFAGRKKVYYVHDRFMESVKMEFGELVCLVLGPLFIGVVIYDGVRRGIQYVITGECWYDLKKRFKR